MLESVLITLLLLLPSLPGLGVAREASRNGLEKVPTSGSIVSSALVDGGAAGKDTGLSDLLGGLQESIYFDPSPPDLDVIEGANARLRCDVSDRTNILFQWTFNHQLVHNQSRKHQEDSDLVILRVDRWLDGGVYECIATNMKTGISITSTPATFTVLWIDRETQVRLQDGSLNKLHNYLSGNESSPSSSSSSSSFSSSSPSSSSSSSVLLQEGKEVWFKCIVRSSSELHVEWFHNFKRIRQGELFRPIRMRLHLPSVTSRNQGVITCKARNVAGESSMHHGLVLQTLSPSNRPVLMVLSSFTASPVFIPGEAFSLTCLFKPLSPVLWFDRHGKAFSNSSRLSAFSNGTLVLREPSQQDQGLYLCSPSSAQAGLFGMNLSMAYLTPLSSSFSLQPSCCSSSSSFHYVIPLHSSLQVHCTTPDAHPFPEVWWEGLQGERLEGGSLLLVGAQEAHSGTYSCVASNVANTSRLPVKIHVAAPPSLILPPLSSRVDEGGMAYFECRYAPSPVTTVTWLKNNQPLKVEIVEGGTENTAKNNFCQQQQQQLQLRQKQHKEKQQQQQKMPYDRQQADKQKNKEVDKEADKDASKVTPPKSHYQLSSDGSLVLCGVAQNDDADYACVVNTTSYRPLVSPLARLYVEKQLRFLAQAPPKETWLPLGGNRGVYCKAQGKSPPKVTWFYGRKQPINHASSIPYSSSSSSSSPFVSQSNNGHLKFEMVSKEHEGWYTCLATNQKQGRVHTHVFLHVIVEPTFVAVPLNQSVKEGVEVVMRCDLQASSVVTRKWLKNGFAVNAEKKKEGEKTKKAELMQDGALRLNDVKKADAGVYACEVSAERGWLQQKEAILEVLAVGEVGSFEKVEAVEETFSKTPIIVAACIVAYLLLVVLPIGVILKKRRKKMAARSETTHQSNGKTFSESATSSEEVLQLVKKPNKGSSIASPSNTQASSPTNNPTITSRSQLSVVALLGKGRYGDVYLAKVSNTQVVVKTFSGDGSYVSFKSHLELFSEAEHQNVSNLLFSCQLTQPNIIVTQYCQWGDLKQFLLAMQGGDKQIIRPHTYANLPSSSSSSSSSSHQPSHFSLSHQVSLIMQCLAGMQHVASLGRHHGDLATRNILIDSHLHAKISCLGLSTQPYQSEYADMGGRVVSLRWQAPEVVFGGKASIDTDVWSFGVLLWEVMTLAKMPYQELSDQDLIKLLEARDSTALLQALPATTDLPEQMKVVLERCLQMENRDNFHDVALLLSADNVV